MATKHRNGSVTFTADEMRWLTHGEHGLSSRFVFCKLAGVAYLWGFDGLWNGNIEKSYPLDPADLNRCVKLMYTVPAFRSKLHLMRGVNAEWNALVENWEALETSLRREIELGTNMAPDTYALMKRLLKGA